MVTDREIFEQLPFVLAATRLDRLGERYEGKVRDNYVSGEVRYLVTTDRLSCFDRVVTTIPFKGQVLTDLAGYWFDRSSDIVQNHLIDIPDPNVMVVKNCKILPIEVVVRGYLTGSAWRDYEAGRPVSGIALPAGLQPSEKLPSVIVTPSTKAEKGAHDRPISEDDIVGSGLVSARLWQELREIALALFARGTEEAAKRGLILVDTKYEFGMFGSKLILADEIHTIDSSRYWKQSTYSERFQRRETPEMLDKEPVRQWLLSKGFTGDGRVPEFTDQHRIEISRHYVNSLELITGRSFEGKMGSEAARIERVLNGYCPPVTAS